MTLTGWTVYNAAGLGRRLSPQLAELLKLFIARSPGFISRDKLIFAMWVGRGAREPEDAAASIKVLITYLRQRLRALGYGVLHAPGLGYRVVAISPLSEARGQRSAAQKCAMAKPSPQIVT